MLDLATIVMFAGAAGAVALIAAAHPRVERLVRKSDLR